MVPESVLELANDAIGIAVAIANTKSVAEIRFVMFLIIEYLP